MIRFARLAFAALACCLGAACAGAETQDVLDFPDTNQRPSKDASSQDDDDDDDAGTSKDGGTGPFGSCDDEKEPNDDEDDANKLETCLQGTVGTNDDVDFLALRIPKSATSATLTVTGIVRVEGRSDDGTFVIINTAGAPYASRSIPLSDSTYLIEVASSLTGGLPSPWTIAFTSK